MWDLLRHNNLEMWDLLRHNILKCGIFCDTTTWKSGIFCDITFWNVGSFATPIACHVRRWGTWSFLVYLRHWLHLQLSDWICQLIAWYLFDMDRFLKRPAPSPSPSSPSSSPLAKKPKLSDKQGNVSASFRAKEFGWSLKWGVMSPAIVQLCLTAHTLAGSGPMALHMCTSTTRIFLRYIANSRV